MSWWYEYNGYSSPDNNRCEYFYNLVSIESELDLIFGKNNYVIKRQQVVYGLGFALDDWNQRLVVQ